MAGMRRSEVSALRWTCSKGERGLARTSGVSRVQNVSPSDGFSRAGADGGSAPRRAHLAPAHPPCLPAGLRRAGGPHWRFPERPVLAGRGVHGGRTVSPPPRVPGCGGLGQLRSEYRPSRSRTTRVAAGGTARRGRPRHCGLRRGGRWAGGPNGGQVRPPRMLMPALGRAAEGCRPGPGAVRSRTFAPPSRPASPSWGVKENIPGRGQAR